MTNALADTHVLITGAASGIGAACARRLAQDGAQLLLADVNGEGVRAIADELGQAYMVHYAASKAGVVSVTRTAAQVLAPYRITSNCICPGVVDTPMWKKIDADWAEIEGWPIGEAWKRRTALIPLGRPETPDDVAGVVSFLASRDSDYMTGQAVHIDGGLVMGN